MAAIYRNGIQYSAGATATFDAVPAEGSPNPITSGAIFEYMSSFQDKLTFDESPTANSTNPVTSEGIKAAIDAKKGSVEGYYYDNKFYVESTHETEITGQTEQIYVDLVTNKTYRYGGSGMGFVELSAALEFDSTPTANSTNPVTSAGIKTAIDTKNDQITISSDENTLTDSSTVLSASTGENPTAMASHALSKFWTYISGKITGAISGLLTTNLTPSKALTSDANGKVSASNTTSTELSYLHGVTGDVQTQFDGGVELLKDTVGWTGKNLLPCNISTSTTVGETFTVNADGSVTASGEIESGNDYALKYYSEINLPAGIYILSGSPSGGNLSDTWNIGISITGQNDKFDYGEGVEFTLNQDTSVRVRLTMYRAAGNVTKTFYPMIRRTDITDPTYEPYHAPVQSISDNIAPTEGATASGAYTAGSYIIWQDGNMYQVTSNVSQGTTWAVGTNLSKVSVGSELKDIVGRVLPTVSVTSFADIPAKEGFLACEVIDESSLIPSDGPYPNSMGCWTVYQFIHKRSVGNYWVGVRLASQNFYSRRGMRELWISNLHQDNASTPNAWSPWVKIGPASKVPDVAATTATLNSSVINTTAQYQHLDYTVINGICYVDGHYINFLSTGRNQIVASDLPKPLFRHQSVLMDGMNVSIAGLIFLAPDTNNTSGELEANVTSNQNGLYFAFTYPVDPTWTPS